jgi:hypothetical protein
MLIFISLIFISCKKDSAISNLISSEGKVKFKVNLISGGKKKDQFIFTCFDKKKLNSYQERATVAFLSSKKFDEKAPEPAFIFTKEYTDNRVFEFEAKMPKDITECQIIYSLDFFGKKSHIPKILTFKKDKKNSSGFIPGNNSIIELSYNGFNGNIYYPTKIEDIEIIFPDKK